jgi:hypothetical protein
MATAPGVPRRVLGRTFTISARSGEKVQLQQGQSFLTIGQQFLSSDEFYNRATQQA